MKTTLVLIRHGETEWTRKKRYCGSNNIPLNATGRKQARELAKKMRAAKFDAVYCSDLSRCTGTARIVFKNTSLIRHPGLREMDFGIFEGKSRAMIQKRYPELYTDWLENFGKITPPSGESFAAFRRRVRRAFNGIISANRGKTCAVVTHGGVVMAFLSIVTGKRKLWQFLPALTGVSVLEINGTKAKIISFNDISHLPPA